MRQTRVASAFSPSPAMVIPDKRLRRLHGATARREMASYEDEAPLDHPWDHLGASEGRSLAVGMLPQAGRARAMLEGALNG